MIAAQLFPGFSSIYLICLFQTFYEISVPVHTTTALVGTGWKWSMGKSTLEQHEVFFLSMYIV